MSDAAMSSRHKPDRIKLAGLVAYGYHGVLDFEQAYGQNFVADIEIEADLSKATASDRVEDTISYAEVAELVTHAIAGTRYNLIEALAAEIAARVLTQFALASRVSVTIHKPAAPIEVAFNDVSVTVDRSR